MPTKVEQDRIHTGLSGERSGYYFDVSEVLLAQQSPFQHVQVVQAHGFGRVMLLDNEIMTTEWDGFVYPEMLMQPALMSHSRPRSVAVIGGGDGGSVTEACRHLDLEEIILCEIDEEVVNAAREFFPELSRGLADPRVNCLYEEGGAWLGQQEQRFDLIAVDGTDPIGPGVMLFEEAFYRKAQQALKPGGIYVQQIECPFYSIRPSGMTFELSFEEIVARARRVFAQVHVYVATVPTYLGSYWAFLYAGDQALPLKSRPERWDTIRGQTRYYSPEIQQAAFVLPPFVNKLLA